MSDAPPPYAQASSPYPPEKGGSPPGPPQGYGPPPAGYGPPPAGGAYPPQQPPPPGGAYPPQQPPPGGYPGQPGQPGVPPPPGYYPAQPGYPAQGPPPPQGYGPGQSTVVVTQPTIIAAAPMSFRESPVSCQCPHCQAQVMTATHFETGTLTWIACAVLCFVGCDFGCCLIPFCVDSCKDVVHTCPNCQQQISRYGRM